MSLPLHSDPGYQLLLLRRWMEHEAERRFLAAIAALERAGENDRRILGPTWTIQKALEEIRRATYLYHRPTRITMSPDVFEALRAQALETGAFRGPRGVGTALAGIPVHVSRNLLPNTLVVHNNPFDAPTRDTPNYSGRGA